MDEIKIELLGTRFMGRAHSNAIWMCLLFLICR
jgi:hypothetical protein